MSLRHPHADATYRIVLQKDEAYGVEVAIPGSNPTTVTSFATEQDAEKWIIEHRRRAERSPTLSQRPKFTKATLWIDGDYQPVICAAVFIPSLGQWTSVARKLAL
jgi:hypothetical protein